MAVDVIFPKVDMDMAEGRIARWFAKAGDKIVKGQPLFEIETDKAAMEIDAPVSGIIDNITIKEGENVPVGEVVAWIYEEGEERKPQNRYISIPVMNVEEILAENLARRQNIEQKQAIVPNSSPSNQKEREDEGKVRATPLARRLAREGGIALGTVSGSGPHGRVQKTDIEKIFDHMPTANSVTKVSFGLPSGRTSSVLHAVWLREGKGRHVPVVLIHGFGADLNSWRGLFAGHDFPYSVLAIDLPAHGHSPHLVPASFDEIASQMEETLVSFGVTDCVLVGHSLGGAVSAAVAARHGVDVRSLLLISSAGLGAAINGDFLHGFLRAESEVSLKPWLRLLAEDERHVGHSFIKATLEQAQDRALRAAQRDFASRFFPDSTQIFDIRTTLSQIQAPTRLIFGAEDRIIPSTHARGLPGKVGVHIFPHCGHMPHIEERADVLDILYQCVRAVNIA